MEPSDVVNELLAGTVRPPSMARPPAAAGFYSWWCRVERLADAEPLIPREERRPTDSAWSLLYVGISPKSETSAKNVAMRFTQHVGGNIGGSTFRQSLASLLIANLQLQPKSGSDRSRLTSEAPLSRWIETSCGATFARSDRPWELEAAVIQLLNPPLNIEKGTNPFRFEVSARRSALRRLCGLGS